MRTILNISLPKTLADIARREVRTGGYGSTSEVIRHLIRLWNTRQLDASLREDRETFERGDGKKLRSLEDLA